MRGFASRENFHALFVRAATRSIADKIQTAVERVAVDDNLDHVAVAEFADRASSQCFGTDVTDAGSGRDAGEAGVGDQGTCLPNDRYFNADVS